MALNSIKPMCLLIMYFVGIDAVGVKRRVAQMEADDHVAGGTDTRSSDGAAASSSDAGARGEIRQRLAREMDGAYIEWTHWPCPEK